MMIKLKSYIAAAAAFLVVSDAVVHSHSVFATQGLTQEATIQTTLQEHVNYGACMARIDPPPSAQMLSPAGTFLDCSTADSFVTFDCLNTSGQTTKATASQMFQTAQLAMITGKKVQLILDDAVKIDGWCLVRRIDLLP